MRRCADARETSVVLVLPYRARVDYNKIRLRLYFVFLVSEISLSFQSPATITALRLRPAPAFSLVQ